MAREGKKPIYKRVWFILLVVVILLAAIGSMGEEDQPESAASEPEQDSDTQSQSEEPIDEPVEEPSVEPEPAREPVEVTVDELFEVLNNNALKASNTYLEQYVTLTGELKNIDAQGDYFSLGPMNEEFSFDTVTCYIEEKHLDDVMNFETGDQITVTGTITNVGEVLGYSLEVD